jgi:salicylate hydroxylase
MNARTSGMKLRVAIVGSGVAGSVIARALAERDDVDLTCFERVASTDQADSGTGLNVGPNGIKSLASLDPAFAERIAEISLPWRRWTVATVGGTPIFDLDLATAADNPGIRIRWSALYGFLRGLVADHLRFRTEVHGVRYADDGSSVELEVDDGGQRAWLGGFDLVVAADGRYSRLREQLCGRPQVRHMGVALARLLVPDDSYGLIEDYAQWYSGPHRLFGYRVPGEHLYLTASFPLVPGAPVPEDLKEPEEMHKALSPAKGGVCDAAAHVIDKLCEHAASLHWARNQEAAPLFRDAGGRVLFVGDAAHPMVPTLGQGATSALEDATAAADALRQALDGGLVDVPAVTGEIAARREPRVRFVMDLSWRASAPMLAGADPVKAHAMLRSPAFIAELTRCYRDAPLARAAQSARRA